MSGIRRTAPLVNRVLFECHGVERHQVKDKIALMQMARQRQKEKIGERAGSWGDSVEYEDRNTDEQVSVHISDGLEDEDFAQKMLQDFNLEDYQDLDSPE